MSIYQADARCAHCKNWVTVYLTSAAKPTKQTRFRFVCGCHREIEADDASFREVRAMPVGGIVATALSSKPSASSGV